MEEILVTIGLPFYNDKFTLELAIKSVLAQTYKNWELVLIDDGSTDGSLNIAQQFIDPRIKLISDGENRGLIYRLNQIASLATGKYLARMDADDLMDTERIAKQINYLMQNKEVDLVDTAAYSINEMGEPTGKRGLKEINTNPKQVLKHAMLLHASVVGKTEWFLNNPYDAEYIRAEDYELWCRTFKHSKFGRVKEPLYIVREGKINVKNYLRSSQTIRKIIRKYGPGTLSFFELNIELLKFRLKEMAYKILSLVNKHDYLVKRRNTPLTFAEKQKVTEIINKIRSVNSC